MEENFDPPLKRWVYHKEKYQMGPAELERARQLTRMNSYFDIATRQSIGVP